MDVRFLGHAAFALEHDGKTVLIDPFLTGNPKAAVVGRRGRRRRDPASPTATATTSATPSPSPSAPGAPVVAITELAGEIGEAGRRDTFDPNLGGTVEFDWGSVRLTPAWHTSTTPSGTVNTPAGLVDRVRRQAHLPPRRHRPVQRPARCPSAAAISTSRWCASAGTTRWTATTPSPPPSCWAPTRSSRATTTPSRPSRPTPQAFKSDVQDAGFARGRRARAGARRTTT